MAIRSIGGRQCGHGMMRGCFKESGLNSFVTPSIIPMKTLQLDLSTYPRAVLYRNGNGSETETRTKAKWAMDAGI